jgi:hypothetical protein
MVEVGERRTAAHGHNWVVATFERKSHEKNVRPQRASEFLTASGRPAVHQIWSLRSPFLADRAGHQKLVYTPDNGSS